MGTHWEGSPAGLGRARLLRPATGKSWFPLSDHPYSPPLGPLDTPAWKKGPRRDWEYSMVGGCREEGRPVHSPAPLDPE